MGVPVRGEDGIADPRDAPPLQVPGHALDQRRRPAPGCRVLERRQPQRAGQREIAVAQDLERHVVALHELLLVDRLLGADPEDRYAQRDEFPVLVAEPAALWRAAPCAA